ncbi:uncharacterized protein Mid1 [Chelonus insularis]|uniref:uncharacterized protein Mid1 n=1 Tax=Chelonus insularis TaxID=460826 RepID=UPI00158D664B|nr:uncharacterized protein LOC118064597 [Chelonus insularis]
MRLEHPPRITGPPPTTKTKSERKHSSRTLSATTTVHSIRSSSLYYYRRHVSHITHTRRARDRLAVLSQINTLDDREDYYDDDYNSDEDEDEDNINTTTRSTAYVASRETDTYQPSITHSHYHACYVCGTSHCSITIHQEHYEAITANPNAITTDLFDNTAFNHHEQQDNEDTQEETETNFFFASSERRKHQVYKQTGKRPKQKIEWKHTAWSEEPQIYREKERRNNKIYRKAQNRKSYSLLFLFYLLVLPYLCSTDPSSGVLATSILDSPANLTRNSSSAERVRGFNNPQRHPGSKKTHPYNEYSWQVNQINPWLSACDLAGPAPADLQGTCGPPEVPKYCPMPCPNQHDAKKIFREVVERLDIPVKLRTGSAASAGKWRSSSSGGNSRTVGGGTAPDQCLFYLEESHKQDICRDDFARASPLSFLTPKENRYWFVSGLRLRHCCEHAAINALAPGKGGPLEAVLNGGSQCVQALDKLLSVDALAARLHCEFGEVFARYDCAQPYSVIYNCTHCKEAYRKWVCSSLVPYFAHEGPSDSKTSDGWVDTRLRPCRSFCQSVEQRCPYLLPGDRAPAYPTQYAGEPTFLCRDPNIPETGEQAMRALHGNEEEECCFRVCSEDEPGLGVCANCTDREPRGRRFGGDLPTAPHCEITAPIQSGSTGQENAQDGSAEMSSPAPPSTTSASSFCGSGGVGSMSSSSSKTSTASALMSLLCLLSMWVALISLSTGQTIFPWSPSVQMNLALEQKISKIIRKPQTRVLTLQLSSSFPVLFKQRATHVLRWLFFLLLNYSWYHWCWLAWFISRIGRLLKWYRLKTRTKQSTIRDTSDKRCFPRARLRNCRSRKNVRKRRGMKSRRRRRRFWFSPWKWKGPS